jgi:hypothetical protein
MVYSNAMIDLWTLFVVIIFIQNDVPEAGLCLLSLVKTYIVEPKR